MASFVVWVRTRRPGFGLGLILGATHFVSHKLSSKTLLFSPSQPPVIVCSLLFINSSSLHHNTTQRPENPCARSMTSFQIACCWCNPRVESLANNLNVAIFKPKVISRFLGCNCCGSQALLQKLFKVEMLQC